MNLFNNVFYLFIFIFLIPLIVIYNNKPKTNDQFSIKQLNQPKKIVVTDSQTTKVLDIIINFTNKETINLKPIFRKYIKDFVTEISTLKINDLKEFSKNKSSKFNIKNNKIKKIFDINDNLLKNNKYGKIIVCNNKRYIIDKYNRKIKEEIIENFDFNVDTVTALETVPNLCNGHEGKNAMCPCTQPQLSAPFDNIIDPNEDPIEKKTTCYDEEPKNYGYCCYGVYNSNTNGTCSETPCEADFDTFLNTILPKILYGVAAGLITTAISVLLGLAIGITITAALWLLAIGLILFTIVALWQYIRTESTSSATDEAKNIGKKTAKSIYEKISKTEQSENALVESLTDPNVNNIVIDTNGNNNNSGISNNKGYIGFNTRYKNVNVTNSIVNTLIDIYINGGCESGKIKLGTDIKTNTKAIMDCFKFILPPSTSSSGNIVDTSSIPKIIDTFCINKTLVNIMEDGTMRMDENHYQCCKAECLNGQNWFKVCGINSKEWSEKGLNNRFGNWASDYLSQENLNIPCSQDKPCFNRFGDIINCSAPERQNGSGGSGPSNDFYCIGNRCCNPLGCWDI